jgi:serine/threonine protein kinase
MGIKHGNLNPHNILIFKNPWNYGLHAKLSNFSCFSSSLYPRLSNSGVGKSGWQSKEQLNGLHSEIRSDLYVLGLILYYAVAGEHVHGKLDHLGEVIGPRHWSDRVRQGLVNVPNNARVCQEALDLVVRLIHISPAKRYTIIYL